MSTKIVSEICPPPEWILTAEDLQQMTVELEYFYQVFKPGFERRGVAPFSDDGEVGREAHGVMIYLYSSAGSLKYQGPVSDFDVVREAGETLVLRHKNEGFFETLGFSSAEFGAWASPPVEPGVEVAQVDWHGETTRVDWVRVKDVDLKAGAPRLVLADGVRSGASGGGVFWEGVHVANNWLYQAKVGAAGARYDEATTAALNPQAVVDILDTGYRQAAAE